MAEENQLEKSTTPSASAVNYHVFLNFRGEDTRKTFTGHLYAALIQAGFRTFLDDDGIEKGEDIKLELDKAILESKVSVIVFSENYAFSGWCLDELVMILGRKRKSGHKVLPVFYHVDPSDVRKQRESIGRAFEAHERKFKLESNFMTEDKWMNKLKDWRQALRELADLKGMVLDNEADGHEAKFIQNIIKAISNCTSKPSLHVNDILVGAYQRAKDVDLWLKRRCTDVSICVIHGIGGVGKTTIAKLVYTENRGIFNCSSFLANVREASKQYKGLESLQKQLLSDIQMGRKDKVSCVDEGMAKIKDTVHLKRILLVLDDVDGQDQLNAVFGMREWFCPGSKIIVTTRCNNLFKLCKHDLAFSLSMLDPQESVELFSWHVFNKDHPEEGYEDYVDILVHKCGGLPLALEVIGSSLKEKSDKCFWQSTIKKLGEIPSKRVLETLKISYDSLDDDHDQKLFLHIAVYFVGESRELADMILEKCGFCTYVGIDSLMRRNLLRMNESQKFDVHQLIQDMAREIVRQESPNHPGERSRIWRHKDSYDILKEKLGTKAVRGIILDWFMLKEYESMSTNVVSVSRQKFNHEELLESLTGASRPRKWYSTFGPFGFPQLAMDASEAPERLDLEISAFSAVSNLEILHLGDVGLDGSYTGIPKKLKWLNWRGCPLKYIPGDFPMDNLVVLDLQLSCLREVWRGNKCLKFLKILNLSYSYELTATPDFKGVPNLEKLILKNCKKLSMVHPSIGDLGLVLLDLEGCENLTNLPDSFFDPTCLKILNISGCSGLAYLWKQLERMHSLEVLSLDRVPLNQNKAAQSQSWQAIIPYWFCKPRECSKITSISLPSSLVTLSIANCNLSDSDFPLTFSNLLALQNLNMSGNPICSLPDSIRLLPKLRNLDVAWCTRLKSLIKLPKIEYLHTKHCFDLETISFQENHNFRLEYYDCNNVVEVEGMYKLEQLQNIDPEMLSNLGLSNWDFGAAEAVEMKMPCSGYPFKTTVRPLQALFQDGVCSTFLSGDHVLSWFDSGFTDSFTTFTFEAEGSRVTATEISLVIEIPALEGWRIGGLSACVMYALREGESFRSYGDSPLLHIENFSNGIEWILGPKAIGVPKEDRGIMWVSYWDVEDDVEEGDMVGVCAVVSAPLCARELGIKILYREEEAEFPDDESARYFVPD